MAEQIDPTASRPADKLDPETPLEWALFYAERGFPVLPIYEATLTAGGKFVCTCRLGGECHNTGKHPRTEHGFHDATKDEGRIRQWWTQWPFANIGLRTGEGNIVLDVDIDKGGDESLEMLEAKYGRLPATRQALTGAGGRHYWFRLPDGTKVGCFNGFEYGLDVRGDGGYVVVEPSVHKSGNIYRWDGLSSFDEPVAGIPMWLLNMLTARQYKDGQTEPWRQIQITVSRYPKLPEGTLEFIEHDSVLSSLWNLRRTDLTNPRNGTPDFSSYDLALAFHFAKAGSTPQLIADLITAFRLRHGNPKGKGYRFDYLQRTVYKALQNEHESGDLSRNDDSREALQEDSSRRADAQEHIPECSAQTCYEKLLRLLAEAQNTGKASPLLDASFELATISDGQFNDLIGEVKKAQSEFKSGLHVDLSLLKSARRAALRSRPRAVTQELSAASAESVHKPNLVTSDRQLADLRTEAVHRLRCSNEPPVMFQRRRELVRYRMDSLGEPFLESFDVESLRGRLSDIANFVSETVRGSLTNVSPSRVLCEDILSYDHPPDAFPVVEAIVRCPIVRIDGSIQCEPGYDPTTRMILCPTPGFTLPPIPSAPTADDVASARETLLDLVCDFKFESNADRTNFIAFCLTTLVRQRVDVVPLCVLDSPTPGSGKGLLTDIACIIATGEVAAAISPPATREEWPKLLAALLDNGRTFVAFDNLHGTLKSDAFEAVLTKPFMQFRQLGQSKERVVPNRAVWCVTGNNVSVSRDMVRRCYRVRIDPQCAHPHLRKDFKRPNLIDHCKAERPRLLAALLVLIRAWHAAGKPPFNGTQLGTYTDWKTLVGGILNNAGFEDFLGNQRRMYTEMDQDSEEWERFFLQIHDCFSDNEFSIRDIVSLIDNGEFELPRAVAKIYGQTTSHVGSKPNPYFAVQLGNVFRAHRETRYGASEVFLESGTRDLHAKSARYRIRRAGRS